MGGAVVMAAAVDRDPPQADGLILVAPGGLGPAPWLDRQRRALALRPYRSLVHARRAGPAHRALGQLRDAGEARPRSAGDQGTRVDTVYGLVGLMDRAGRRRAGHAGATLVMYRRAQSR